MRGRVLPMRWCHFKRQGGASKPVLHTRVGEQCMNLAVVVGIVPALCPDPDDGDRGEARAEFAQIKRWPEAAGGPTHSEPPHPAGGATWECSIGRPHCF